MKDNVDPDFDGLGRIEELVTDALKDLHKMDIKLAIEELFYVQGMVRGLQKHFQLVKKER